MKNRVVKIVGILITIAAFAFLVDALIKKPIDFALIRNPWALLWCGLPITIGYCAIVYVSADAWRLVLSFLHGGRISRREVVPVYVRSNIAKYFPGNFMHFAGRNVLGHKLGLNQLDMAFSTVTEVLTLIITAAVWSLLLAGRAFISMLAYALGRANPLLFAGVLIIAAGAVAAVIIFIVKKGYIQKYRRFFTRGFITVWLRIFGIYSVTMLVPGLFLTVIFAAALGQAFSLATLPVIVAAYTVSWVVGYATPGAPGGLGVREAAMTFLLQAYFDTRLLLLAALVLRIYSIFGDVLAFFVVPLIQKAFHWKAPDAKEAMDDTSE